MLTFADFISVLVVASLGLLCLFGGLCLGPRSRVGGPSKRGLLVGLPKLRRSVEWGHALSAPLDFERLVRGLSTSAQLELAEHLLQEGEFTRILVDVVGRIAVGSNSSMRWRSVQLLELDAISPVVRAHLADRVLRESADGDLKIQVIENLVAMLERGVADAHVELPESIAAMIAARLGDRSEGVRKLAQERFQQGRALRSLMSAADPYVAHALMRADALARLHIQRFVDAHQALLPRSCAMARRCDLTL